LNGQLYSKKVEGIIISLNTLYLWLLFLEVLTGTLPKTISRWKGFVLKTCKQARIESKLPVPPAAYVYDSGKKHAGVKKSGTYKESNMNATAFAQQRIFFKPLEFNKYSVY